MTKKRVIVVGVLCSFGLIFWGYLQQANDLLDRDVAVVDMRNADRPTLRMNKEAADALRRVSSD